MKRKYSILLALPATNALSLANFQSISITAVPLLCQITYDGQIPSCQVSDFTTGCRTACLAGLDAIAADVIEACDGTHATSNSLLGIIQDGGIRAALCPMLAETTTKTTTSAQSTSPAIESVTLPTGGAGVTGGLGFQTSTTAIVQTTTAASTSTSVSAKPTVSTVESTSTSTSDSPSSSETSTSTQSASTEAATTTMATTISADTSVLTSASSSSTSSKATTTTKASSSTNSDSDSGGGSPFDIQSNAAAHMGGNTIMGFWALAAWVGFLAVR